MEGYLAIVLHAHLPFVRHPEHERFLEENWLFEAVTECYLPLLQRLESWQREGLPVRLTLSISPTLAGMLRDSLLQARYDRHLEGLIELTERELQRTYWDRPLHELAGFYHQRLRELRELYLGIGRDLVGAFARHQESGQLEIITCAATHAVLPLLQHAPSVRAQVLVARDHYQQVFGRSCRGFWLPECAYDEGVEAPLQEADLRWFIVDAHGLLGARPTPRYGVFAPIYTPEGIAVFGRDPECSRQVWSKEEGYPGDPVYRDFYRDIGFDLDLDYVRPYLPTPDQRGFTGIKYYSITGPGADKRPYDRALAVRRAGEHAAHFLQARLEQVRKLQGVTPVPPILVAPYDAELFGHWWYEGPEFLDALVRLMAQQRTLSFVTPWEYLQRHATHQVARPMPSSWGEAGYWQVWVNDTNAWIWPHLRVAQQRMTQLARKHKRPNHLIRRALQQAARELLLAQASDWPFILRTGTSPGYARQRIKDHLLRFHALYDQLLHGRVDPLWLEQLEQRDNLFPNLDPSYWA
jgi:1,4-alpha-glucan branching enzyme